MRGTPGTVNPPIADARDNVVAMPIATRLPSAKPPHAALRDWLVVTLRPQREANALLSSLRRHGADAVNLAVVALRGARPADIAPALHCALSARYALFSSPAAVRHARRIDRALALDIFADGGPLSRLASAGRVFAPGVGTATALGRAGIAPVRVPTARFDSEGLLALPELEAPLSGRFALIGAPGGRGLLDETLARRGAQVIPVHVYQRIDVTPDAAILDRLVHSPRAILVVSSRDALDRLVRQSAPGCMAPLQEHVHCVVASERLANAIEGHGFHRRSISGSAHTDDLVAAVIDVATHAADTSAKDDSVSMTT